MAARRRTRRKKVTAREIARRVGISQTAVSFVLNGRRDGRISDATRDRVLEAALAMGYTRATRPQAVGWRRCALLYRDLAAWGRYTTFYADVYEHLRRSAAERRIEVMLHGFPRDCARAVALQTLRQLKSLGYEAFVTNDRTTAEFLLECGEPVVFITHGPRSDCTYVGVDDRGAGKIAAEHLLARGHRTGGVIYSAEKVRHPRVVGFERAFRRGGGEVVAEWELDSEPVGPQGHTRLAELLAGGGRTSRPTALYCIADSLVFHGLRACAAVGLRVPEDMSLIGTDNLFWGGMATPAFTTVDLGEEAFAAAVLDGVLRLWDGDATPVKTIIPAKLVERDTVGAPPAARRTARRRRARPRPRGKDGGRR